MNKLFLLFTIFLLGLVFLVIPRGEPYNWFMFSSMKLTLQTHVYFICEKLVLIILAYILVTEAQEYREAIWVFFVLMVVDLVDYFFSYNSVWFRLGSFPISMNVVKCVCFGLVIFREWLWTQYNKL